MKLEVALVVFAVDMKNPGNNKCLMLAGKGVWALPKTEVGDTFKDLITYPASLLRKHTKLDAKIDGYGWIDLKPLPVVADVQYQTITFPYMAMIPDNVVIDFAEWVPLMDLFSANKTSQADLDLIKNAVYSY